MRPLTLIPLLLALVGCNDSYNPEYGTEAWYAEKLVLDLRWDCSMEGRPAEDSFAAIVGFTCDDLPSLRDTTCEEYPDLSLCRDG